MVLAHLLIHTVDTALKDRKVAFDRVRMCIAADVSVRRMNNSSMTGELLADSE
jgi:hypothetical protein